MSDHRPTSLRRDMSGDARKSTVNLTKAPDGGWGWMVVFGSFMIHLITDGVTYSFGVFYDEFLTYFNEGKGPTAWILSILVGITLCSGPISSLMVNRWGCRTVTIIGSIIASICMLISIWAKSIFVLYFTIGGGTGFGFGLIYLPAIVSVSVYFEKKRSLATGIAVCGSGFGTFIFAPFITQLLQLYTWKGAMMIVAAIVLLCVIFGALFKPLQDSALVEDDLVLLRAAEAQTHLNVTSSAGSYVPSHLLDAAQLPVKSLKRPWSSGQIMLERNNYGAIQKETNFISSTKSEGGAIMIVRRTNIRILERPDIFYQRSLLYIPPYNGTNLPQPGHEPLLEGAPEGKKNFFRDTGDMLHKLLDLGLLKNSVFILFSLSNFLTSIGFNVPYVYIVSRAKSLGLTGEEAGLILSAVGIANTIGRIILGYLSDKAWVNRLFVYNTSLTLCGIATALSCFCVDFYSLVFYGSIFGFTIGAYVGLTSVILVDLFGLDKLTNAFGLLLLFQGIASLIGPPIAGQLYDALGSYDPGFYVAGSTIALSGIILFLIPVVQKCRQKNMLVEVNTVYDI